MCAQGEERAGLVRGDGKLPFGPALMGAEGKQAVFNEVVGWGGSLSKMVREQTQRLGRAGGRKGWVRCRKGRVGGVEGGAEVIMAFYYERSGRSGTRSDGDGITDCADCAGAGAGDEVTMGGRGRGRGRGRGGMG